MRSRQDIRALGVGHPNAIADLRLRGRTRPLFDGLLSFRIDSRMLLGSTATLATGARMPSQDCTRTDAQDARPTPAECLMLASRREQQRRQALSFSSEDQPQFARVRPMALLLRARASTCPSPSPSTRPVGHQPGEGSR